MNCCLQKCASLQFTSFNYYLVQDNFKNQKMMKIQLVHKMLHAKQFLFLFKLFSIGNSFEFKASQETRLI